MNAWIVAYLVLTAIGIAEIIIRNDNNSIRDLLATLIVLFILFMGGAFH